MNSLSARKKKETSITTAVGTHVMPLYVVTNLTNTEVPFNVLVSGREVLTRVGPYKSIKVQELTTSIIKLASGSKKMLEVVQE